MGDYEWACFAAQQAGKKAVQALYQKLGADAWGHSITGLLQSLPEDAVWDAARRFAQELIERLDEVQEVRVFGSLVPRECVPGSDVDLLILLRDHPLPFHQRLSQFLPRCPMPVGVDVFPYTRAELEQMLAEGNHFVRRALEEGVILARRSEGGASREVDTAFATRGM